MKNVFFFFTIATFSLCFLQRSNAQCYVRLDDASGFNTDAYQDSLQAAAAKLCAIFDTTGFAGQFKVYDFGFYLHQESTTGAYPEAFSQKIAEVQALSPYYLLFGKQTDKSGVYTKFWVELRLPDSLGFYCWDTIGRGLLLTSLDLTANIEYGALGNMPDKYHFAEIRVMDKLKVELNELQECCYYQQRGQGTCDAPCLSADEIYNLLELNGFNKLPISAFSARLLKNDSLPSARSTPNFIDLSNFEIELDGHVFDIDETMALIFGSLPSQENAKGVFTDNYVFCNININQFFSEMNSNDFGTYIWVHVWFSSDQNQKYLFYRVGNSNLNHVRNLSFYGYAPIQNEISQYVSIGEVKETVESIFYKNGYEISVQFIDNNNLLFHDLFNHVINNPPGTANSLGYSQVYDAFPILARGVSSYSNYIRYKYFIENAQNKDDIRNYVLGYTLSHEFLHQILAKSFIYIFDWESHPNHPYKQVNFGHGDFGYDNGGTDGHIVASKNLLFPGDGLNGPYQGGNEFALPEDKNTGTPSIAFLFSGKYLPKKNNPTILSDWERIMDSHKGLIYRCWILRRVELNPESTPEDLLFLKKMFTHEIIGKDFTKP